MLALARAVAKRVALSPGGCSFVLVMPDLGRIRILATRTADRLRLRLRATRSATRALLADHAEGLRAALHEQGCDADLLIHDPDDHDRKDP
jgi:hypothetical protein